MSASEVFPILSGLMLGAFLGRFAPRLTRGACIALSIPLGALATIASGEFRLSWGYLLIDAPLVAVFAVLGAVVAYRLRPALR